MNELQKKEDTAIASIDQTASIMQAIVAAAADPSVDPDKMERLMNLYERIEAKKAEALFSQSMTACQAEMSRISADATNPQTRSNYASYGKLDKAMRPKYTQHGFSLSFDTADSPLENHVRVLCHVSHIGGHTRTHHVDMDASGKGAKGGDVMTKTHASGSAMTYGMRYLLKLIFNVAIGEEDDDGNTAGQTAMITEDQYMGMKALITELNVDEAAFAKICKVGNLQNLPANKYDGAMKRLEAKRGKNENT